MIVTFRPIVQWPRPLLEERERKPSPFSNTYQDTLTILDDELVRLDAQRVVVQLALSEADLRLDGMLRAHAKPAHPGVILAFDSSKGPLMYATDRFTAPSWKRGTEPWHANLRAIALGLRALRAVDRYGIAESGEQYTGWRAIGSGHALPAAQQMSRPEAARVMADLGDALPGDVLDADPDALRRLYRRAAAAHHPDAGGEPAAFQALSAAYAVLGGTL